MYFCLNTSSGDPTRKGFSMNVKLVRQQQGAFNILKKINRYKATTKKYFYIINVQILNKDRKKKNRKTYTGICIFSVFRCLTDQRCIIFLV